MIIFINSISLIIYLIFTYNFFYKLKEKSILFLIFYFSQFWIIISSYVLDIGGFYSSNLHIYSSESLGTTFLIFSNIFIFYIIYKNINKIIPTTNYLKLNINKYVIEGLYIIIVIYLVLVFSYMFINGIPILIGIDRAQFFENMNKIHIISFFMSYFSLINIFCGIGYVYLYNRKKRLNKFIFLFFLIILFLVLSGNKFSSLFLATVYFLTPILLLANNTVITKKNIVLLVSVFILFIASAIYLHYRNYSYISSIGKGVLGSYLFQRIFVFQGGIWHRIYEVIIENGNFIISHIITELKAILGFNTKQYTGLKYLMEISAEGDFIYDIIEGDYLYTGGFPAILLATFNWVFFFPVLYLIVKLYLFIIKILYRCLKSKNIVIIYLSITLYVNFNSLLTSGDFSSFFTINNFIKYSIIMLIYYYPSLRYSNVLTKIKSYNA